MTERPAYLLRPLQRGTYAEIVLGSGSDATRLEAGVLTELHVLLDRAESDGARAVLMRIDGPVASGGVGADRWVARTVRRMLHLPVGVVAEVAGDVHGSGLALLAAADVVMVAADVRFCLPDVVMGADPTVTAAGVLARMSTRSAALALLTGGAFDGEFAVASGLATGVVRRGELSEVVRDVVGDLVAGAGPSMTAARSVLNGDLLRVLAEDRDTAVLP